MANKRILIVGGVAGGASTAARARRLSEDAEIILFERGKYISFANCGLPYHIGGAIPERKRLLVQTPAAMRERYRIDVRTNTEVTAVDRDTREVLVREVKSGNEYREKYDALVLSPGADPFRPPIPGIDSDRVLTLRTMTDMDRIKKVVEDEKPERTVIVGGGYIGLELTEALRERGRTVTLVELAPQVMVTADPEMAVPVKQQLALHGVDLRLNTSITAVHGEGTNLQVVLSTGDTVNCGLVIMSVGVRPEITLARDAGLEIGERGGIVVDEHQRTSDPDIYAVGDAVEVTDFVSGDTTLIPLAGPANRQGRIAADTIFDHDSTYHKTQGTAICKVFDLTVAVTGMNEKSLKKAGRAYEKIYVHPASHATYYPGASPISVKLLFDPENGAILGAQAVGRSGVDKRIDVLATALRAGMKVTDLQHLELAYAPPYGSAKDVVNYAGFVASNVLHGDMPVCHAGEMENPRDDQFLLDVRSAPEVEAGTIPGAHHIPIDELRDRLDEMPRNKEILVFCQVGLRGYLATRILKHNGFNARNLTGGYKTWTMYTDSFTPAPEEDDMHDDTGESIPRVEAETTDMAVAKDIDASGLQCPGPIMQLKKAVDTIRDGEAVRIRVSDPGFVTDAPAWCKSTGNRLVNIDAEGGAYTAVIQKGGGMPAAASGGRSDKVTLVVFSNDFDRAMASFIIANGAASMGSEVVMFFTFWGLNILRQSEPSGAEKTITESMFGFMMPRGAEKLNLSKMNMGGMGLKMMKDIMKKKNVATLPELIASAQASGVKLVACAMTMDIMGIKEEELIDGVDTGGVAMYLQNAGEGNVNLFV